MKLQQVHGKIWIGPGVEVAALCKQPRFGRAGSAEYHTDHLVGILDVADDFPEYPHHRDILFIHAGLNDGPEDWSAPWGAHNSIRAYVNAVMSLDFLVQHCGQIYIHCHGGVSRSGIVACLYWGQIYDAPPRAIHDRIKIRYPRINVHPKHWDVALAVSEVLNGIPFVSVDYWYDGDLEDL